MTKDGNITEGFDFNFDSFGNIIPINRFTPTDTVVWKEWKPQVLDYEKYKMIKEYNI